MQCIKGNLIVHGATGRDGTVFRRHRRRHYQPFIHWMFYQEIHVELRCSFQDGIILFQELFISCKEVMLPDMLS